VAYKARFCWCCVVSHLQSVLIKNSKPHKAAVAYNTAFNCGGPQTKEMEVLISGVATQYTALGFLHEMPPPLTPW